MSEHNQWNPAPGVKVAPLITARPQGLTMGQAKAAKTFEKNKDGSVKMGVLRAIRRGGPIGLGMRSTILVTPSINRPIATRSPFLHRTPGKKGSGGHCRAPSNMVFQGKVFKTEVYERQVRDGRLSSVKNKLKFAVFNQDKGKVQVLLDSVAIRFGPEAAGSLKRYVNVLRHQIAQQG